MSSQNSQPDVGWRRTRAAHQGHAAEVEALVRKHAPPAVAGSSTTRKSFGERFGVLGQTAG